MKTGGFAAFGVGTSAVVLITFAVLHWLGVPSGHFIDWVVGIASFWWLLGIVTLPWNLYFQARGVLEDAGESRERNVDLQHFDTTRLAYVRRTSRRMLVLALSLHLVSGAVMMGASWAGLTPVGYISGALALLLTLLRPAWRAYEYIRARLSELGERVRYPRRDVISLRNQVDDLGLRLTRIEESLDPSREHSFAHTTRRRLDQLDTHIQVQIGSSEAHHAELIAEHDRLKRDVDARLLQQNEDSRVLGQVRELIRFIRTA